MSREEFLRTGKAQCDEYPDGSMICNHQGVIFAALDWTQFFEFKKDGLSCVAFGRPISQNTINCAMVWLMDENYIPINAEAGKKSFSFSQIYEKSEDEVEKNYKNFSSDLPSSDRFNAYLIKQSLLKEYLTTDQLPANAVLASLGGSKRQGKIYVCFEAAKNVQLDSSDDNPHRLP